MTPQFKTAGRFNAEGYRLALLEDNGTMWMVKTRPASSVYVFTDGTYKMYRNIGEED